jgi:hypothetical protein
MWSSDFKVVEHLNYGASNLEGSQGSDPYSSLKIDISMAFTDRKPVVCKVVAVMDLVLTERRPI